MVLNEKKKMKFFFLIDSRSISNRYTQEGEKKKHKKSTRVFVFFLLPKMPSRHGFTWKPYTQHGLQPTRGTVQTDTKVTYASMCADPYCKVKPKGGSRWCLRHGCTVSTCSEPYKCPLHTCDASGCHDRRLNNTTRFCRAHRCASCPNSIYNCPDHVCATKRC